MNAFGGSRGAIFLSRSDDLVSWSLPEPVLQPRHGAWWDWLRVGIGPPLIKTDHGWLLIYHGVKETVAGCIYRVGLAMLDLNEPTRVLHRHPDWVFRPAADYERGGDVPNAVFPCGLVVDEASAMSAFTTGPRTRPSACDDPSARACQRCHDGSRLVLLRKRRGSPALLECY